MSFKIAIVDDEDVADIINNIKIDSLTYDRINPNSFGQDIEAITDQYDLILMDQKLAGNIGKIPYMGTTLIQELRTRMAEKKISPKPIILWSIAANISSYKSEKSSHNLVDAVWNKDVLIYSNLSGREDSARNMVSLISGYRKINSFLSRLAIEDSYSSKNFVSDIFGLKVCSVDGSIPESVIGHLINKNHQVTHAISNFLINSILRFSGFLIDEKTISARCGIDIHCQDWSKFRDNNLIPFKYNGLYSDFYERWWAADFESWWLDNVSGEHPAFLNAAQRVKLLNEVFSLSLSAAQVAENHSESRFWHTCVINGCPIDEVDAFKLTTSERREWQDHLYASFNAINDRKHKDVGYELTSRDRERFLRVRKGS